MNPADCLVQLEGMVTTLIDQCRDAIKGYEQAVVQLQVVTKEKNLLQLQVHELKQKLARLEGEL